jgi:spore germination protein YaaH
MSEESNPPRTRPSRASVPLFDISGEAERLDDSVLDDPDDVPGRRVASDDSPDGRDDRLAAAVYRQRRMAIIGAAVLVVVALIAVFVRRGSDQPAPPDRSRVLPIDAWAPYWTLDDTVGEFAARASTIREISPFWFEATGATSIVANPNVNETEAAAFLDIARSNDVPIVPSVIDAMPAGGMAAVLADPAPRTAHVNALVAFVTGMDAAGLDLDYEQFAFADDRSTWATTQPNWTAFIIELSGRLRSEGLTLTVSIPPVYDAGQTPESGYWVYDYAGITPHVDRIRVMAYDYSTATPGPIAPLDWVRTVIAGTIAASGSPDKLVLGLPLYGYTWPITTVGTCPPDQMLGRTTVNHRAFNDLLARRQAVPVFDTITGEYTFNYNLVLSDATTSCTETRTVWFVDPFGAAQRKQLALDAGFAGVSLWALGFDSPATWDNLDPPPPTPPVTDTAG